MSRNNQPMPYLFSRLSSPRWVLLLLSFLISTIHAGCLEKSSKSDGPVYLPDAGSKSCDSAPNNWVIKDIGPAALLEDKKEQANLFSLWGADNKTIFAAGSEGKIIFFDGETWKNKPTPTRETLTSVWGTSPTEVWAAGFSGTVLFFDGNTWQDRSPPPELYLTQDGGLSKKDSSLAEPITKNNFWGIWASGHGSTTTVFAVGDSGIIFRLTSGKWSRINSGVSENLMGVWGIDPKQVFIVGDFGVILVGSTTFSKALTGSSKGLKSVWGRGANDVYAVGVMGTILHFNGKAWKLIDGAPKQYFRGVWGPINNPALTYLVGWDGTLLRMSGGPLFAAGATFDAFNCITSRRLEGIWGMEGTGSFSSASNPSSDSGGSPVITDNSLIWVCGVSGTIITGP